MQSVPFPIPFCFAKIRNLIVLHLFHNPFSKTFLASALVLLRYINHLATPAKLREIGIIVRPSPQSRNKNAFKSVEKPFSEDEEGFFCVPYRALSSSSHIGTQKGYRHLNHSALSMFELTRHVRIWTDIVIYHFFTMYCHSACINAMV